MFSDTLSTFILSDISVGAIRPYVDSLDNSDNAFLDKYTPNIHTNQILSTATGIFL